MPLPVQPPTLQEANAAVKYGSSGWPVYALQMGFNDAAGCSLTADGDCGRQTEAAIKDFQRRWSLTDDGIAGPATKAKLAERVCARVDRDVPSLPDGLARQMARFEGGDNPSAINQYDPPGATPGTDCGLFQFRCYEPYSMAALKQAFSPFDAAMLAMSQFQQRVDKYMTYGWTRNNRVRAQHCALLAHNWPVGANDIAFEGQLSSPTKIADWALNPSTGEPYIKMLDGHIVSTRLDWVCFYAGLYTEQYGAQHQGPFPAGVKWGV